MYKFMYTMLSRETENMFGGLERVAGTSRKKENKKETKVTESAGKNERQSTAGRSRRKPAEEESRPKVKTAERKTGGKRNEAYVPEK